MKPYVQPPPRHAFMGTTSGVAHPPRGEAPHSPSPGNPVWGSACLSSPHRAWALPTQKAGAPRSAAMGTAPGGVHQGGGACFPNPL